MIVEMRKLHLVAMSYERDAILNALRTTNAVEVKECAPSEDSRPLPVEGESLKEYLSSLEGALQLLAEEGENYAKEHKCKSLVPKDGFEVTYTEFMEAARSREQAEALAARVKELTDRKNELKTALGKTERTLVSANVYAASELPFDAFCNTVHTKMQFGTLTAAAWEGVKSALDAEPLAAYSVFAESGDGVLFAVLTHASAAERTENLLRGASFAPCAFTGEQTGKEYAASLMQEKARLEEEIASTEQELYALGDEGRALKLYCDYLGFELEKAELTAKMRGTERTFLLEAYVPKGAEERIREALSSVSGAVYFEFTEPADGETVPTLLKNNKVVENFETITNMYSPPSYREFDPNTVMSFFYSLFLGFIMADVVYGLIMLLGGGAMYWKNRARGGGLKSLSGVFAVGGIFAIFWGVLFNSVAGISAFPFTVMPDAQTAMWTFIGISIPSVLIVALLIGVAQLFAGYICRVVQCCRWGRFWDGMCDGMTWAVFSLGAGVAIVGLVEEFNLTPLAKIGGIVAAASLLIAMLTAGRREKLLGKFTKGFGALYSVINYASDILSYARLYGLMLSGAVIAQIISQYAVQFISTSVPLAILGVLLMVVGHTFNLAISLLGAYIHDARLQYVEFYGRFYEGEGEVFAPLGSKHKYVWVARQPQTQALAKARVGAKSAA